MRNTSGVFNALRVSECYRSTECDVSPPKKNQIFTGVLSTVKRCLVCGLKEEDDA